MSRVEFPTKLVGETLNLVFDFSSRLAAGETISTQSVVATVYSGTDGSPASMISGAASASGTQVTQKVIGGVLGVTYLMTCTITTSIGQTLIVAGFLTVVPSAA